MTDRTVAITPGSGDQVAFDDNSQIVKVVWGATGTHTKVEDGAGKRLPVNLAEINVTVPVSGTFWQATQPISASALPLPSGAATAAKQPALGTAGTPSADVISVQGVSGGTAVPVSGTFWQTTQPVSGPLTDTQLRASAVPISAASLPLPTGAATAAKQPALGTAGSASSDVLTIQGIASMTAVKVDGSAVTQPVSGTFWQATQPVSAASLPLPTGAATEATLSGVVGATNESAAAGDTSTSGLNGLLKRLLQRITTLLAVFPTTIDTNSGVKSASTLRVVLATDQPQLTNKLLVTPDANSAVNVAQINGVTVLMGNGASGTGAQRVTIANDSTGILAGVTGAAAVAHDAVGTGVKPLLAGGYASAAAPSDVSADGDAVRAWHLRNGAAAVVLTAAGNLMTAGAGAVAAGTPRVTLASDDPAVTALANPTSVARLLSAAASTNATNVKNGAGRVFTIIGVNNAGGARFLKLYNKASSPTVGTDTPVATFQLPALQSFAIDIPRGLTFGTGISYALTTAAADADTGALTAGDVTCLNIAYA